MYKVRHITVIATNILPSLSSLSYLFQLNTAQMLDNVSNLYQYWFRNESERGMGLRIDKADRKREVGLLVQEVETVIPEAKHHTVCGYVLITN